MPQNKLSASFSMGGGLDPRKYATKEELQEETENRISGDNQLETSINEINNTIGNYGDIVTHDTDEFATASQGSLADSAVQPSDLATVATSGNYNDLTNKPTIPTVNNPTITLTQGGTTKGTFTLNQNNNATIDFDNSGASSVSQLTDVELTNLTNGQGLLYNSTTQKWENADIGGGDITDVQVDGVSVVTNTVANITGLQPLLTDENAGDNISILNGEGGQETVSGNGTIVLEKAMADGLNSVTVSGGLKRSLLPDGYTQYDYITATGTQYFVTDYYPSNITEVKTKTFVHKQPTSPMVTRWTGSPTNDTFGFYMGNVSGRLTFFFGTYSDTKYLNVENVKTNIEHDIYMGVNSITFDGTSYPITRGTFTSTQPIYIGAFNQTGSSLAGVMYGRIYPVQFIENGKIVRHYIPCANENNVVGLYEVVTGTFLENAGTGTLKKGRPTINIDTIPSDYTRIDFLQATGTQYIDSGVIANFANNKIEQMATVQYTTSNNTRELMGTNGYGFWGKNASNNIEAALGQTTITDNALVKNVISWTTNPDGNTLTLNVNSNQYTSTASSFVDANYAYYVFALGIRVDSGASASFLCHAKVWDYTIAVDDEVVCYLIPVKRNSDNALGMYNVATGTFRANAGTGTFTAGSDVALPSPSNPIPIVSNNGQLKYSSNLFDQSLFNTDVGITVTYYTFNIDNGTYTMSTNIPYASGSLANVFIFAGQTTSGANSGTNGVTTNTPRTITVTDGKYTVAFRSRVSAGDTAYNPKNYNWMLAKSSTAQNYQPYIEGGLYADGITETITDSANNTATAEMLLSMGNYTDTQEILSGAVTRKVGVIILNGTEEWTYESQYSRFYASFTPDSIVNPASRSIPAYCSHFEMLSNGEPFSGVIPGQGYLARTAEDRPSWVYLHSSLTSVAQFTQWLAQQYNAGTPVIIVYPLATETTETVTGQTLTTITGDNTLTISQASIDNLPIVANFDKQGGLLISFVNTNYATETWVENKGYALTSQLPTKTSDLTNDSGFVVNKATGTDALTIFGTAATASNAINIGASTSMAGGTYSVAIGNSAKCNSSSAVAIGRNTSVGSQSSSAVALGYNAKIGSSVNNSIQLGNGTNNTSNTLAVGFNGTNYQLLDGATGLIPSGRIPIDNSTITVNASGQLQSSAGGAVDSVNGQTGTVVLTASDVGAITSSAIANMQTTTNLVTSVSSSSTDSQYPSAKCLYDIVGDVETLLQAV